MTAKPCLRDCKCKCGFYYGTHEDMDTLNQFDPESHDSACPNAPAAEPVKAAPCGCEDLFEVEGLEYGHRLGCPSKPAPTQDAERAELMKVQCACPVLPLHPISTHYSPGQPKGSEEPPSDAGIDFEAAHSWAERMAVDPSNNSARAYLALKAENERLKRELYDARFEAGDIGHLLQQGFDAYGALKARLAEAEATNEETSKLAAHFIPFYAYGDSEGYGVMVVPCSIHPRGSAFCPACIFADESQNGPGQPKGSEELPSEVAHGDECVDDCDGCSCWCHHEPPSDAGIDFEAAHSWAERMAVDPSNNSARAYVALKAENARLENEVFEVSQGAVKTANENWAQVCELKARLAEAEDWFLQVLETEDIDMTGVWKQARARGRAILAARANKEKSDV